ncbi:MAG: insulinase family protein [Rikenellaceae bacterium]
MKTKLISIALILAFITSFTFASGAKSDSVSSQVKMSTPITPDPDLRWGKLKSGTSYYIRHNAKPQGQADFYIVSDVGAIQEDDDQQGLAHFLEHMAFNGTKNFDGKEIIEYLETIGVKFGSNLNASTSWDVTTYLIKDVPVAREGVIDSALMILHDWAHFITPIPSEIDKERGVIKEELRTRDNANWRSTMELIKALGKGTKYAERNLIGYLDYLESFEPEVLTRFYEEWYRPEYQAIIIVGDIDAEQVEQKLIALMADIEPSGEGVSQKEIIKIPDNEEPIISIFTDPEMQYSSASIFIKRDAVPQAQNSTLYREYLNIALNLMTRMQNERLQDITMQPNAPFLGGYMSSGNIGVIPTMDNLIFTVQSADGKLPEALTALVTEMERTRQHGFTESEFERAKEDLMSSAQRAYANRSDRYNNSFVQRYINNFRFNMPIPSAEEEWEIDSTLINKITLAEVNALTTFMTHTNNVVALNAPQKEGIENPSQEDVLRIINDARNAEIAPFEDTLVREALIGSEQELIGSKVVKESKESRAEAIVWRLDNGIEVVVKPTKLKADEVIVRGYTQGGASTLSDEDYYMGLFMPSILGSSGVSKFSAAELGKQLSGKIAGASLYVGEYSNGVSASSSVADVETMLQLIYLNFTAPRFDLKDFEIFRDQMRANIVNSQNDPDYIASKRFAKVAYGDSPRKELLSMEMIDAFEFEKLPALHDKLFGNGADFRFTIIGSVDTATLKPMVERYIGSLPVPKRKSLTYVNDKVFPIKGAVVDDFTQSMIQPKVSVMILYSGKMKYDLKNKVVASYLNMALDNQYLESVREEKGGTYGVRSRMILDRVPENRYKLNISFDTNTDQADELIPLIESEIEKIATQGVDPMQISKSREFMLKDYKNSLERNSSIAGYISALYTSKIDYFADYEATVNAVTSDDIKDMAQQILKDKNRVEVVMRPE